MTVFHADFIYVTLRRLRPRLHIAIKDLLFSILLGSSAFMVKNVRFLNTNLHHRCGNMNYKLDKEYIVKVLGR